jgi:hypothetical protein
MSNERNEKYYTTKEEVENNPYWEDESVVA